MGVRQRLTALCGAMLAIGAGTAAAAGQAAAMQIYGVDAPSPVSITYPPGANPQPYAEIPPWQDRGGWFQYFISTGHSYECQTPDNLFSVSTVNCNMGYTALTTNSEVNLHPNDPQNIPSFTAFRRNYNGQYGAEILPNPTNPSYIVSVNHGENKNEKIGNTYFTNTVMPSAGGGYSGWQPDGTYYENWDAYFGFVGASRAPTSVSTSWGLTGWSDLGPIVWPKYGYTTASGGKASWGVRHPSSFVKDGYLYVFYLDTGGTSAGNAGISVARSPVSSYGQPGSWQTYTTSGNWADSLPSGLSMWNMSSYYSTPGPDAKMILGGGRGSTYFSVVHQTAPTDVYLGVESRQLGLGGFVMVSLWRSTDLVNWTDATDITQFSGGSCETTKMCYAHLVDDSGYNDDEVTGPYVRIIGTGGAYGVQRSRIHYCAESAC